MRILALLDPFEGYNFKRDTSHLLLLEASRRGHEVGYATFQDLCWRGDIFVAAAKVEPLLDSPFFNFTPPVTEEIESFDAVLIRKDPPVDFSYLYATQLLSLREERQIILNPPSFLRDFNEKLIIFHFPKWIPKTLVSSDAEELRRFHQSVGGRIILKPLEGYAGKGTQLIKNEGEILPLSQPVMVQEYLPAVSEGEKRIHFLEGEILGTLLKIPPRGSFLTNPDLGGTLAATDLTPEEESLAREVGLFLKKRGVFFAGADLIGGKLTEINTTSPGLLWELNDLYDGCFEKTVIDRLEEKVHAKKNS